MAGENSSSVDEWRAKARQFTLAEVIPRNEAIYRDDHLSDELVRALGRGGFMGLGLPAEYGGQGRASQEVVAVLEELAAGSAALATLLSVHLSVCAQPIAQWGSAAQRQRFLPPLCAGVALGAFALTEPGAGSDAARLVCRYRRDADRWVLNGSKMFITNGARADTLVVFATRDQGEGHRGISAFIVPRGTPGFSSAQKLAKLGLRGSETMELVFDDTTLPADHLLGEEGKGLTIALGALTGGRVGIAACALGVARAAFEEMQRITRRSPTDGGRNALAQAYTELLASRALLERAAARKDAGLEYADEASAAKLSSSRAAVRLASQCVDLAGPAGTLDSSWAGRLWRDARVFPIVEGTTEIQQLILGRTLAGE